LSIIKLSHNNIIKVYEYGIDGQIKKPNGNEFKDIVYIVMEYVAGGLLFDIC